MPLRRDAKVRPKGRKGSSLVKSREQHFKQREEHAGGPEA